MTTKTTVERRSHPRRATSFDLQGSPEAGGELARMTAKDLSLGGLYCTSSADFPEMTRLAVRVMLPDGRGEVTPLELSAVVVRRVAVASVSGTPRFELALFFPALDQEQRRRLTEFIES